MDLDFSRNQVRYPRAFPHPPLSTSSQSSSRRSSINSDKLSLVDHKAIPRRPGSARFKVLPNISQGSNLVKAGKQQMAGNGAEVEGTNSKRVVLEGGNVTQRKMDKEQVQRQGSGPRGGETITRELYSNQSKNRSIKDPEIVQAKRKLDIPIQASGTISPRKDERLEKQVIQKTSRSEHLNSNAAKNRRERLSSDREHLPAEPGPDEKCVMLAIKLPTGERLQRGFRPSDRLQVILHFAEAYLHRTLKGCELVCLKPKIVFKNLQKTIQQSNLPDKTVLYIQLPAPV